MKLRLPKINSHRNLFPKVDWKSILYILPLDNFRRDSMFLVFRMGRAVNGGGLCDIDKVLFRVTKSRVKNRKS